MAPTRWGILSAGKISNDFCVAMATVLSPEEHQLVGVAARSPEPAKAFAEVHNIPNAYESYEELLNDPNIDAVYVGSIHPQHLPLASMALENGKAVLCEKPLCMNVRETMELINLARRKNVFLMEAIWSRFLPAYQKLKEELDNGTIGEVKQVIASFGQPICEIDRMKSKILGGGTTLDLGIYNVQFASLVFGRDRPDRIIAAGFLNEESVDMSTSATLLFSGGRTATLVTHARVELPNEAYVIGTRGILKLPAPMWCPVKLESPSGTHEFPLPKPVKETNFVNSVGLAYQCKEVRRCLLEGLIESPVIPHEESLILAEVMESIRKQVGVAYPQDEGIILE